MGILSLGKKKKDPVIASDMSQPQNSVSNLGMMPQQMPLSNEQIQAQQQAQQQAMPQQQMMPSMDMAQRDAQQIQQQPQQGLMSKHMDNLGERWGDKMSMWDDSKGLFDFAQKNRLYNQQNGIRGYQAPQQPMLMAKDMSRNYGGQY